MMKWFYFICHYGPGHQSQDDGFLQSDAAVKEIADDLLNSKFDRVDWPIINVWEVQHPPHHVLQDEKQALENRIAYAKERLAELAKQTGSPKLTEAGKNEKISERLTRTVRDSLMRHLHKRGVFVESSTVDRWRRGDERPIPEVVERVLEACRRCEKYPAYKAKR